MTLVRPQSWTSFAQKPCGDRLSSNTTCLPARPSTRLPFSANSPPPLPRITSHHIISQVDRASRHATLAGECQSSDLVARTYERPRGRSLPKWDRDTNVTVRRSPPPPALPQRPSAAASTWGVMAQRVSSLFQYVYLGGITNSM